MRTRKIGSLDVPVVGLGCNNFGGRLDATETAAVLDAAIDAGVTFLDTADIYGATRSEEYMGQALVGRRDRVLLATKFGGRIDEERKGARPDYVRRAVEASLQRLRTDRIDLYQLHTPDPETPIADTLGALNDLVVAGKVREIGCSNFSVAQIREGEVAAPGARFVSVQNNYSLLQRDPETDGVLAECDARSLAFLPYFPLASGLLTGKYRRGSARPEGTRLADAATYARFGSETRERQVEALIAFAEDRGRTLLELAFGWLLSRPAVASVIAGATRPAQVRLNAASIGWELSPTELAEIDSLLASVS